MFELVSTLQPLLLGAVLVWAARFKLFSRYAEAGARRSALVSLIGEQRALPAYRLLGGVEMVVGVLLILPPAWWLEGVAATALTVGFLGYLGYAKRAAPDSSCGCMSAQRVPVSWRSIIRAVVLVVASGLSIGAVHAWPSTLVARPLAAGALLVAEAALVVALSAELDSLWLVPLRQLRANLTHPLRGGSGVPLLASVQQLQLSEAYRRIAAIISSDVREHWDEGEWRMVCYTARYQGRPATAVFAVPRLRHDPEMVRVALVDDATGVTLWNSAGAGSSTDDAPQRAAGLALGTT